MINDLDTLASWIDELAELMEKKGYLGSSEPPLSFLQNSAVVPHLLELVDGLQEDKADPENPYYSACIFAIENCVAQLKPAQDSGNKLAEKRLNQLMIDMTNRINSGKHSLGFWLPILNVFYEMHVELLPGLKNAYVELVNQEEESSADEDLNHLNTMRDIILELADLSAFGIAEHFFAQSYAMPADFFMDLVTDLCSIKEGHDIAILALLHPKQEVRDVVVIALDQLIPLITLSSISLTRLQIIKDWYPIAYQEHLNRWIKIQRRKGVIFSQDKAADFLCIKASEIEGNGIQGLFIDVKKNKKTRLCGLMFKQDFGIKDAWVTSEIQAKDVSKCYIEALNEGVTLRTVDQLYLMQMTEHFLALTLQQDTVPDVHFLEIQELLGLRFKPNFLDIAYLIEQLSIKIAPFTHEVMQSSFQRSRLWFKNKRFTQSWYVENADVDKSVNRCCSFVDGVKICALKKAMASVFFNVLEKQREKWLFHFLWMSFWAKHPIRKNEKIGQDSFFIAYAIHTGFPLTEIPLMHEICRQTVIHSVETMSERGTYISKQ